MSALLLLMMLAPGHLVVAVGDDAGVAALAAHLRGSGHDVVDDVTSRAHLELLRTHGVVGAQGCGEDCLVRLAVLAEADRALRVTKTKEGWAVLCVDTTPRSIHILVPLADDASARKRLDEGLAFSVSSTTAMAAPPPMHNNPPRAPRAAPDEDRPAPKAPAPATRPSPLPGLAGASLLGAGALCVVGGAVAAVLSAQSILRAEDARFQDDALGHAADANVQLTWTGVLLGTGAAAITGGGVLLLLQGSEL